MKFQILTGHVTVQHIYVVILTNYVVDLTNPYIYAHIYSQLEVPNSLYETNSL